MVECGRLLHRIQEWGDNQLSHKMCAQILRKCLQRVLFPSNIERYFCPFSDLSLVCLKDSLLKIPRLLFGTPFTFSKLCSCLSPLGTAWPSFSRLTLLSSLQSHTLLSSRRFPAHDAKAVFWTAAKQMLRGQQLNSFPIFAGSSEVCRNEQSSGSI